MADASAATPFAPFAYSYGRDSDGRTETVEFHIIGAEAQVLQVLLPPGKECKAEPGALFYMNSSITCQTRGQFGFVRALSRMLSGESFFVNTFVNRGESPQYVAFATPTLARVCPLDLNVLGEVYAQSRSFFASIGDVDVSTKIVRGSAGFFGGEGMVMQRLSGKGLCFVLAGGTPTQKRLRDGETVYVDKGCLVAFQKSVSYEGEHNIHPVPSRSFRSFVRALLSPPLLTV